MVENQTRRLVGWTDTLTGLQVILMQAFQMTLGNSLIFSSFVLCFVPPFFKTFNIGTLGLDVSEVFTEALFPLTSGRDLTPMVYGANSISSEIPS